MGKSIMLGDTIASFASLPIFFVFPKSARDGLPMRIFLDSSVLVASGFHLGVGSLSTLEEFARRDDVELVTSQVVIDEVVNKYRQRLVQEVSQALSNLEKLSQTAGMTLSVPLNDQVVLDLVDQYRNGLINLFERSHGWIMPIPDVCHSHLVERSIAQIKPFGGKNDGYRDALIWHSVLDALEEAKRDNLEMLYFGTGNSGDFAANRDAPEVLHGDMIEDIKRRGLVPADVMVFTSLGEIISNQVKYRMKELAAIQGRILSGGWRHGEFDRDVADALMAFMEARAEYVLPDDADRNSLKVEHLEISEYRDVRVSAIDHEFFRVEVDVVTQCRLTWTRLSLLNHSFSYSRFARSSQVTQANNETRSFVATVSFVLDGDWSEFSTAVWQEDPFDLELLHVRN